jgi:hypothetical protein
LLVTGFKDFLHIPTPGGETIVDKNKFKYVTFLSSIRSNLS